MSAQITELIPAPVPSGALGQIPGLRSRNPAVVLLSSFAYFAAAFASAAYFDVMKQYSLFGAIIGWMFLCPFPFICCSNIFRMWGRLPFIRHRSERGRRILGIICGSLCFLIGIVIVAYL